MVVVGWSGGDLLLDLLAGLQQAGHEPLIIGDALRPRRVTDATAEPKAATDPLSRRASAGPAELPTRRVSSNEV